ncbi:hypothetical protein R1flu_028939 [Riccia fluitans]|uniref:VQ domain-containing protein n=1 Tax=Riccia fluitans TaxID=41844 RepID=A0ABD1XR00_9MARC
MMNNDNSGSSNNNNTMSKSSSSSRQNKRPTPLRMVPKEEVRQFRPPVIIHTYSPKIIHVDAAEFSTLVQKLTGRGMKRKPDCSPRPREYPQEEVSYTSSADSGCPQGGAENGSESQGFVSPRGPLVSFKSLYQHRLSQPFEQSTYSSIHQGAGASANEQANLFANAVLAGSQYSPLFGSNPHMFSPLPSPNFLNPSFIQDLPVLSPSTYQAFDPYNSQFNPSPTYARHVTAAPLQLPGSGNAFKDMALRMSRDSNG